MTNGGGGTTIVLPKIIDIGFNHDWIIVASKRVYYWEAGNIHVRSPGFEKIIGFLRWDENGQDNYNTSDKPSPGCKFKC